MATSIISAGDAANLGVQTTGGDDGVLVLRSGAAGAKVDALSIAASGAGTFVGEVTATGFTGTLDGVLGGGTPAAATVTTFTSNGIDDNADAVAITINSSENVGIGTSSPASRLNVVGNIGIGTLTGDNAYNPTSSSLIIQGGNQSGLSTYTAVGNSTSTGLISYYSDSSGGFTRYLDIVAIGSSTSAGSNIRFLTGAVSATERMRIDTSGNVGIGTASPSTKLHVAGDVTVAGAVTGVASINSGQLAGNRNLIINGDFTIFQRGTSQSALSAAGVFLADRWTHNHFQTALHTRQAFAASGTHPGNSQYVLRASGDSTTATSRIRTAQAIESINCIPLRGKTITMSLYVRCAAATMPTSALGDFRIRVGSTSATADSSFITTDYTASGQSDTVIAQGSLPTTWTKITNTYTVPTNTNNIAVVVTFDGLPDAGTGDWYEISQVQVEVGSTATPFEQRSIGTELALCERYYETSNGTGTPFSSGDAYVVTAISADFPTFTYRVAKRAGVTLTTSIAGGTGAAFAVGAGAFYQAAVHSIPSTFGWAASSEL
jgi:hypothetical protein